MTYESCCEKFDVRAFVLSVLDESEIANIDELPPLKRPKALFRLAKDVGKPADIEGNFRITLHTYKQCAHQQQLHLCAALLVCDLRVICAIEHHLLPSTSLPLLYYYQYYCCF
jgi:hypothetical protein